MKILILIFLLLVNSGQLLRGSKKERSLVTTSVILGGFTPLSSITLGNSNGNNQGSNNGNFNGNNIG
jgi:hypothetical protein